MYADKRNIKHYELINSEGTILQVEKVWDRLYFNFKHDKYRVEITKDEIYKFLSGTITISDPQGKTYNIENYKSSICYDSKKLVEFLN